MMTGLRLDADGKRHAMGAAVQPRPVFPGELVMITRRCTQRQFLMRPDEQTTRALTYCLVEAAQRYDIDVMVTVAESNHHHTVTYDRHARFPLFIKHFHKMFARCQNARLGRLLGSVSIDGSARF